MNSRKSISTSHSSVRQRLKQLGNDAENIKAWKQIVFLIFEPFWMLSIDVNIFLNAFIVIYTIFYLPSTPILGTIVFYFFEVHYGIDTFLSILHMKWDNIRKSKYHEPKHISLIIFNIATLIPLYEIYYLLLPRSENPARDLVRLKCVFRFIVLYVHMFSADHKKVNTFGDLLVKLIMILTSVSMIIGTIWYIEFCKESRFGSSDRSGSQFGSLDKDDNWNWFIGLYIKCFNVLLQNISVGVYGQKKNEIYLLIVVLVFGFNVIYLTFIANLITNYMHHRPKFYIYLKTINNTYRMMKDCNVNMKTQKQVVSYCEQFWNLRQGCLGMPVLFTNLPLSFQKDITLDIFWELFRHSQLFRETEPTFKRMLSVYIQNEFVLPGTYLYKRGRELSKLFYIVSGNVQVLSNEKTPVINLTSGTILGEVNILIPIISSASVVSTDTCILHTLELNQLFRGICNTSYNGKYFYEVLKSRIEFAKKSEAIKKRKQKSYETLQDKYSTPIKRMKTLWNTVSAMENGKITFDLFRYNMGFCSKYLDLMVMNENLHKSLDKGIILTNDCPFVFRPNSSFRLMIYFASLIATILQSILLPYCAMFIQYIPKVVFDICIILDLICWLELYIDLLTAVNLPNLQITKPVDIILFKMKSLPFFLDIICCVPIDYLGYIENTQSHTVALLKLNRVLRIYKLYVLLNVWEESTSGPTVNIKKLVKYVLLYFYFSFFFAALMYSVACPSTCLRDGWFSMKYKNIKASSFNRFISSFNLALSLVLRCHFVYTIAYNVRDNIIFLAATFVGYVLFAFCVTECTSFNLQESLRNDISLQRFHHFHEMLYNSKINPYFIKQTVRYIEWNWHNRTLIDQIENCIELPHNLKDGIEIHRLLKLFRNFEGFKTFPDKILLGISRFSTIKAIPPNIIVVSKGQFIYSLHIIERGECVSYYEKKSKDYVNAQTMRSGTAFPVLASLFKGVSLITVSTSTTVIMVSIPVDRLFLYLEVYNLSKIYDFCRTQSFVEEIITDTKYDKEVYKKEHADFLVEVGIREKAEMKRIFKNKYFSLGKFYFLKHLMLRETFHPEKSILKFWETFRCICAFSQLSISITSLSVLFQYSQIIYFINVLLDISALADIYIRLHVQYYNEIGILVVHPICTAKYYLTHSFITDLYGVIPVYYFKIYKIFVSTNSWRNYHLTIVFTRTVQIYRVFCAFNHFIAVWKGGKLVLIKSLNVFLIYMTIGVLFMNILLASACEYNDTNLTFDCSQHFLFNKNMWTFDQPFKVWTLILYIYASFFTGTSTGFMHKVDFCDTIGFYIIIFILFGLKIYLMTFFIASLMSDSFETIVNRNTIKTFVEFSRKENVIDNVIFSKMLADFNFRWQKKHGINFMSEMSTINLYMRYKLLDILFGTTVANVSLFEGITASSLGIILSKINIEYYNKGSMIITCNDVQDRFYIVYKGSVQVSFLGDMNLKILHHSGAFGSISNNGFTRQTINVQCQEHCEVLYIRADVLNSILKNDLEISRKLKYHRFLNQEFFSKTETYADVMSAKSTISTNFSLQSKLGKLINSKIPIGENWVRKIANIFYLHFIPCATIATIFIYSQVISRCTSLLTLLLFNYAVDLTFWLRAFLEMHLYYISPDSGSIVKSSAEIKKRYLTSYTFPLDCLILIPFETFLLIFTRKYAIYGIIPRLFRLVHFFKYYKIHKMQMNIEFEFTFYIYFYLLAVMVFTGFLIEFVCEETRCGVVSLTYTNTECDTNSIFKYLLYGILYGIQMMSTSNYKYDVPVGPVAVLINSIVHLSSPYIVVLMMCCISTVINSTMYTKMRFFVKIKEFEDNLKNQNVSKHLQKTSTEYLLKIWQANKGENIPSIIETSPRFLRETFLMLVYGHHLRDHFLFSDTHVDFLRQLVPTLKRMIYLPNSQILESGDNDGCMYFIHFGEISVKKSGVDSGEPFNLFILKSGSSFGECCGLFNLPHEYSYICNTTVDLLVLQKNSWDFLLKFFPASHEMIIKRAKEYQVNGAFN